LWVSRFFLGGFTFQFGVHTFFFKTFFPPLGGGYFGLGWGGVWCNFHHFVFFGQNKPTKTQQKKITWVNQILKQEYGFFTDNPPPNPQTNPRMPKNSFFKGHNTLGYLGEILLFCQGVLAVVGFFFSPPHFSVFFHQKKCRIYLYSNKGVCGCLGGFFGRGWFFCLFFWGCYSGHGGCWTRTIQGRVENV